MVLVLSNHSVLLLSYQKKKALQTIWGAFPLLYLGGISVKKQTKERMFSDYPDVVNVKQMCEMLGGIGMKTAYGLLQNGEIRYIKIGKSFKIPKVSIVEYLLG